MKETVKKWLRDRLTRLPGVQRCVFPTSSLIADPDNDLIVQTWAGIVIHLHLVDQPVKPARVRRLLENATGAGIASLFVVDVALLPRVGEPVPADRWFVALQYALAPGCLYVYQTSAGRVSLRAAQFYSVNKLEVALRYGAEVTVTHLRHYRHTARHSALKGYWLVADFEPEAAAHTQYRQGAAHMHPPGSGTQTPPPHTPRAAPPHTPPPPPREKPPQPARQPTQLERCYVLLGVPANATREEVRAAFRRLAFALHPDVSDLPKDEAEARFKVLNEAYAYIKLSNRWG